MKPNTGPNRACDLLLILSSLLMSLQAFAHEEAAKIFPLSVASGDPSTHGFVLMTHLNTNYIKQGAPLILEISESEKFENILITQSIKIPENEDALTVNGKTPQFNQLANDEQQWIYQVYHPDKNPEIPVKIAVSDARIIPDHYYYYRFRYLDIDSRTGRAKSLPSPDQHYNHLKLAVLTCQDYTTGYYDAFNYLAEEEIDFVLHLGDVIYEYDRYAGMPDKKIIRPIRLPHGVDAIGSEAGSRKANSLADFRLIYRKERSDPAFQRALERHTWIFTRDDHEFADNISWDYKNSEPAFPEHDPRKNWSQRDKRKVMVNALQAWSEYIPMESAFNPHALNPQEVLGAYFKTYHFGTLADLYLIAGRVFRGTTGTEEGPTMLGTNQKSSLLKEISESQAEWQLLGNQTLMSPLLVTGKTKWLMSRFVPVGADGTLNDDAWDGFQSERQELLNALSQKDKVIVFTGDMHTSLAGYLKKDFKIKSNKDKENIMGAEFMTPSVTSPHFSENIRNKAKISGFTDVMRAIFKKKNPHFKHFHGSIYGYSIAEIQSERMDWFVYKIDKKKHRGKKLRKYLYYIPEKKKIGKLNKADLKKNKVVPGMTH